MSKKATEFQKREMSRMYRGKEIFKPLNTGWVDERVACVRTIHLCCSKLLFQVAPSHFDCIHWLEIQTKHILMHWTCNKFYNKFCYVN